MDAQGLSSRQRLATFMRARPRPQHSFGLHLPWRRSLRHRTAAGAGGWPPLPCRCRCSLLVRGLLPLVVALWSLVCLQDPRMICCCKSLLLPCQLLLVLVTSHCLKCLGSRHLPGERLPRERPASAPLPASRPSLKADPWDGHPPCGLQACRQPPPRWASPRGRPRRRLGFWAAAPPQRKSNRQAFLVGHL